MTKAFSNWLTQRNGEGPSVLEAPGNDIERYSCGLSPFYHRHALPFPCKDAVVFSISRLFFSARPSAVAWVIIFLVVDPVNRVLGGWAPAHVFEKCLKGILPARAYGNAAAAIPTVENMLRIIAALQHATPGYIFDALTHRVGRKTKPRAFFAKAAAAFRISTVQRIRTNDDGFPAGTAALPSKPFEFPSYRLQRREPSELPLGEVSHAAIMDQQKETFQENSLRRKAWHSLR